MDPSHRQNNMNMNKYMTYTDIRCNDTSPLSTTVPPDRWSPFTSSLQYSGNENEMNENRRNNITIDSNRLSLHDSSTDIGIEINTTAITTHLPVLASPESDRSNSISPSHDTLHDITYNN